MSTEITRKRRIRQSITALVTVALVWLTVEVGAGIAPASNASSPTVGALQIVAPDGSGPLAMGGSATKFTLMLPSGASCTGDSANAGYRVQSFMILSSVDPTTLKFGSSGPLPVGTGAKFSEPLFTPPGGTPYVNAQTAAAETPGGPGKIINIPTFDSTVWSPGDIPAGSYLIGIACTVGPSSSSTQLDRLWDVQVTFTTNAADSPAGVSWSVASSTTSTTTPVATTTTAAPATTLPATTTTAPATTTTAATTTTTAPATTTTAPAATTTTAPAATTTTAARATTTSVLERVSPMCRVLVRLRQRIDAMFVNLERLFGPSLDTVRLLIDANLDAQLSNLRCPAP